MSDSLLFRVWQQTCAVFGVPHNWETSTQLYPDDVLCLTSNPHEFVRLKRHHVFALYRQFPTDLLQLLIRPVIQPGPVHMMICLRYDNALLDMFAGHYGCDSRISMVRRHVHRLLKPLIEELLFDEPPELIANVFEQAQWIARLSGNDTVFVAHFPLLKFGSINELRIFMTSFLSLVRQVDLHWTRLSGGIPLIYDNLHVFDVNWCAIYRFSAIPFEGDTWNDKLWHASTCTKPEFGAAILTYLPNFCHSRAARIDNRRLDGELLERAYNSIMQAACSFATETTRLSCSSLNCLLRDATSFVKFEGAVTSVPSVLLELLANFATEKRHRVTQNIQDHVDGFLTKHPFLTAIGND